MPLEAQVKRPCSLEPVVRSTQSGPHPRLAQTVRRHLNSHWRQPLHRPTIAAFEALCEAVPAGDAKLVLDSGCGTGQSTRRLARVHPDCLVIGVDKSPARLSRLGASSFPHCEANAVWLRAELSSFWRLARLAGWRLDRHYLLYPNPWPKAGQLRRRWHAHPVFPDLLALGGRLEMRCNWKVYADEFASAVNLALGGAVRPQPLEPAVPGTPFERKYSARGQRLYSVVVSCGSTGVK